MIMTHSNTRTFIGCIAVFLFLTNFDLYACTAVFVKTNNEVLVGNNEDGCNPETKIWIEPAQKGQFGRLYFGFSDLSPQGGINEKGLWFDAFGLSYENASPISGKVYPGDLQDKIMAECATVSDVINLLKQYNRSQMNRYQWMIGDKEGNSAIIEDDTIICMSDNYQIITNFRQSVFPNGEGYDCLRFRTAQNMIKSNSIGSIDGVRKILAATHAEGDDVTLYSYIADLTNGLVYVYHFHNYENVVILDVKNEISKGKQIFNISELFPVTVAAKFIEYKFRSELSNKIESRIDKSFDKTTLVNYNGKFEITAPEVMARQTITISTENEHLNFQLNDGGPYRVYPQSSDTFFMMSYGGLDFKCNFYGENRAEKIVMKGSGLTIEARRIQ